MEKPRIVTAEEWQQERDELLKAEKETTRALDELAARRRRLPMVRFANGYAFDSPTGTKSQLGPWTAARITTARAAPRSPTTSP